MLLRRSLLVLCFSALAAGDAPPPLALAVDSIGMTVADLDRSVAFYKQVLGFETAGEYEAVGDAIEHTTGVFGARVRTARLRLGREHIELTEFVSPRGRALPADSRSNDRWFQHIAIVTPDMKAAYAHLRAHRVRHSSPGPQRLPDWNPNAGGIEAFYFHDPDGHALEIIAFPPGKGSPHWRETAASSALFLGIDHTAIVISDIEASTRFYKNVLGMAVAGDSENYGPEQERLNSVFGARLRIRAMRASGGGPGIEFLQYLAPGGGRPFPADAQTNDLTHWQTRLRTRDADAAATQLRGARAPLVSAGVIAMPEGGAGFRKSILVRDPDGHAVQVTEE